MTERCKQVQWTDTEGPQELRAPHFVSILVCLHAHAHTHTHNVLESIFIPCTFAGRNTGTANMIANTRVICTSKMKRVEFCGLILYTEAGGGRAGALFVI